MKFSGTTQAFYSSSIDFGNSLPGDAEEINDQQAELFYRSINRGSYIYVDEGKWVISTAKPSDYHSWDTENNSWIMIDDAIEQKRQDDVERSQLEKVRLRALADAEISWRQDAVDAGIATEQEVTKLAKWKKYRVLLMRVDTAAPVWPTAPEA